VALRRRLALTSTLVVAGIVVLASLACYLVMRGELRGQVDDQLTGQGRLVERFGRGPGPGGPAFDRRGLPSPPPREGGPAPYVQLLDASGEPVGAAALPVDDGDRAIAAGDAPARLSDRQVGGEHVRVSTTPIPGRGAVMLGRSLAGVDSVLARLRAVLALLCLAGTALAWMLGRRAADRFAAVLERLEAARAAQRQLVADASHELRTPVTALRTNAELLLDRDELPAPQRRALLSDVVGQAEELSALVGDVIELARGDRPAEEAQDVRLDALVAEAVDRARRHAPGVEFAPELEPVSVDGVPERLGRAVNNLLDNAGAFSPAGGTVDVTLRGGTLTVRDHGPGVPANELPHIFDRFFRAASARDHAGSGLGLAIVKQVAEHHGGSVSAASAPGGGLAVTLTLPGARPIQPA
jgi:two-component system, OmpR family, sensor histidine kinase MprB